jgi:hypothetical protein
MNTQFNHKERYNATIQDGTISIVDTFANAAIAKMDENEVNKLVAISVCTLLNSYWREIATLRGDAKEGTAK